MVRTASPPHHGQEEGFWFIVFLAVMFALTFAAVILFVPR